MIFRIATATGLLLAATGAIAAPTKPKSASTVVITNAREASAIDVSIGSNGQSVRLSKPLAPNAKATLKLPKTSGCLVAVAAAFDDDATAEISELDVCKDKNVRLTD